MTSPWHVCVLIPARDEEKLLPRCLRSVLSATANLPKKWTYDIILAVDSSSDDTLAIGRSLLKQSGMVVEVEEQMVGFARQKAAEVGLQRYWGALENCWIANTDADCEVPSDWLLHQIKIANDGIHALAGIVDVDNFEEHESIVMQRFKETYLIHVDGTHPHVHGANLGVRADAYIAAGGWSPLKTAEDHDLWNRIREKGFSMKSDATLCVLTSGRRVGRAPNGFAEALSLHNNNRYFNG